MKYSSLTLRKYHGNWGFWARGLLFSILSFLVINVEASQLLAKESYYDTTNDTDLSNVVSQQFKPIQGLIKNRDDTGTLWIKLKVNLKTSDELYIYFTFPTISKITLYTPKSEGVEKWSAKPLSTKELVTFTKLDINPNDYENSTAIVYLSIKAKALRTFDVDVMTKAGWLDRNNNQRTMQIFETTMALTLFLWSLLQFLFVRKWIYGFISVCFIAIASKIILQSGEVITTFGGSIDDNNRFLFVIYFVFAIFGSFIIQIIFKNPEKEKNRKIIFITGSLIVSIFAIASTYFKPSEIIIYPLLVIVFLASINFYDCYSFLKRRSEPNKIIILKLIIFLALILQAFLSLSKFMTVTYLVNLNYNVENTEELIFIFIGFLVLIFMVLMDQEMMKLSFAETLKAKKLASHESLLRKNQQSFLSMLLHEIRTPLSVIKISTDTLIQRINHFHDSEVWIRRINVAIDNISQVMENCVQAEKHEEGLIKPVHTNFLIKNEISNLIKQYVESNSEFISRLKIETKLIDSASLETDVHYFRSILLNLLSNALKYSPPNSPISIRLIPFRTLNISMLRVEVQSLIDKLDSLDLNKLFQRYYRAESSKKYSGTGLGLWISQTLANQLGAHIEANLTSDHNIVFSFNLPLSQQDQN